MLYTYLYDGVFVEELRIYSVCKAENGSKRTLQKNKMGGL
jgi:hypothetical protein